MTIKSILAIASLFFLNGCFLIGLYGDSVLDSDIALESTQIVEGLPASFRTSRPNQKYMRVVVTSPEDFLTDQMPTFYGTMSNCPFDKTNDFVAFGPFLPDGRHINDAIVLPSEEARTARAPDADGLYRYHLYMLIEAPEWQERFGGTEDVCLAIVRPGMPRALFSNAIRIDVSMLTSERSAR